MAIEENRIPVREDVRAACEILGFDPLQVAHEGRMAVFLPASQEERAPDILRGCSPGAEACAIGRIAERGKPKVLLTTLTGVQRILDVPLGEQLPRIC